MYPFSAKTFAVVIALLLTGEVLIVAFGPFPPGTRKRKVMDLPVIKQVQDWRQNQRIHNAFEEAEDGVIRVRYMGKTGEWHSAEELKEDLAHHSSAAYTALNTINRPDQYWGRLDNERRKAQEGDLSSMVEYLFISNTLMLRDDSLAAATLLENHPSASAKWILKVRGADREWLTTREAQLLQALTVRENIRYPQMTDNHYDRMTESNTLFLDSVRQRAEEGDGDAEWIVNQLRMTPVWRGPGATTLEMHSSP